MSEKALAIQEMFSEAVRSFSSRTALQFNEAGTWKTLSYKELEDSVLKTAAFLRNNGFQKSDSAVIVLENRREWPAVYLGAIYAGLICVPLDPHFTAGEIVNLVNDCSAKILFCSGAVLAGLNAGGVPGCVEKIVVLGNADERPANCVIFSDIEMGPFTAVDFPPASPEDTASLLYTSGTTGRPKGVLLTHKNICANFQSLNKLNIYYSSDNVISVLPLYHTYPFMVTMILPLFIGAKITYSPLDFKPQHLAGIIKDKQVTLLAGVPQLFSLVVKTISERVSRIPPILRGFLRPLIRKKLRQEFGSSLRLFISGGARLEQETANSLSGFFGIKVIEGYGLTETSPVVTLNPPGKVKYGSVGKAIPDVQVKILDADSAGIGEVLIQGPNVFKGYLKQPELTAQVIRDGWFHSGDLGYLDKDGYLFISGRKNDVIVLSSGKNIYPEELEEYYRQNPYIKEICIFPKEEKSFGSIKHSLYAVIVPNGEIAKSTNEADITTRITWELESMQKGLPAHKHLMGFTLTNNELPRNVLRKVKRFEVKQKYLEQKTDIPKTEQSDSAEGTTDVARAIITYLSGQVHRPVRLESHLEIDLGIDSLSRVELALGLESLFKIPISDSIIYKAMTVGELIEAISPIIRSGPSLEGSYGEKRWSDIVRQPPPESMLAAVRIRPRIIDYALIWFLKKLFLSAFRGLWFLRISGTSALPKRGPVLLCPNHASFFDGLLVFCSLPFGMAIETYFFGLEHIFRHPILRWVNKLARLVPIDNNRHLNESMRMAYFLLRENKAICIFPEGQRSIDGTIAPFKKGAAILMKESGVPVVPICIIGSHRAWPRGKLLPRIHPIKIIFGKPLSAEELIKKASAFSSADEYDAISQALREEVLKLRAGEAPG